MEVPQNGWFRTENPIKMDDLGVPLFKIKNTYHYKPTIPPASQVSNEEGNYFWSPGA